MRHHGGYGGVLAVVLGALLLSACDSSATRARPRAAEAPAAATPAAPAESVTLAFAGDVHFAGGLAGLPGRGKATLGPMSAALREADVAMVNLETAVTTRREQAPKELEEASQRYWFRSPPAVLDVLDRSGVDVVSVANNHGADYGVAGVRDTLAAAEDAPVGVVGAGLSAEEAFTPYRVTVRGTDVAVLAADASPLESRAPVWAATPGSGPGLAAAREPSQLLAAVRSAAASDDLVVVYLHWGEEGNACATGSQRSLAAALSEAGADVVVGAHAHTPLGAGLLGETYVSYGLGNFFWYHGIQADTGVLQLTVTGSSVVEDTWVPGKIRPQGGNAQPLSGAAATSAEAGWRALRACTDLAPGPSATPAASADGLPAYAADVRRIGPALRQRMTSQRAACPVALADLRHLSVPYIGFDGRAHTGELVVAADVAADVVGVFGALYDARFPIQRMRLVDEYAGDDNRSMAANNTSGYNCRRVAGSTSWSDHAYGRAIDINPVQNPYVTGASVQPAAGRPFVAVERSASAAPLQGVIRRGDVVSRAFAAVGWTWGGDFSDPDFQHFSVS